MLYTFSHAQYDLAELQITLANIKTGDAIVLWQDGVLQAVKNPQIFTNFPNTYVLAQDATARAMVQHISLPMISLDEFVMLTERYFPQVAL